MVENFDPNAEIEVGIPACRNSLSGMVEKFDHNAGMTDQFIRHG